jgi:PAS domain S-box-containing protein
MIEDLIKSNDNYRKMIEEIEDYAILSLDVEGNVVNWNRGAEKIKGYTAEEIIGKNFKLFYTKEDRENKLPEKLIEKAALSGKASDEGWRVKKDGTQFWGSILITAIHNDKNNVIGFSKVTRDLTDKRNAEEIEKSLEQAKAGFLKILNVSPSGMIITDAESRKMVQVNKNFLETFGYTIEETIGLTADELGVVSKESRAKLADKLTQQGHIKNENTICNTKNGKEIDCIVSADLFEMDGKKYILSVYHDITERIKAEETEKALAQTKKGFNKLFHASPSGMIILDMESRKIVEVNEKFLETFGYIYEEVIGFTSNEIGYVSDETQIKSNAKLQQQGYLINEEIPARTKDGRKIDTIFSVELFEMEGKRCCLAIFSDITLMKDMERKIVESEAKYRKIIEEAGDVLYTSDAQGKFTYINQRITTLTGYTSEELMGKHFSVLIAPEWQEIVRASYQNQFKNKIRETVIEFLIHTKTGKNKWVEQAVIMQEAKGIVKGFQCIVRDVTERKKATLLLAEQKKIIEQKNKDILDSINYAKRIQDAIFPPEELVKELIPQSFVLFKPKDVISGDFYWVEKFDNKTFIAAVDCTGHGVPGALLSIVGYNLLSKSINEHGHTKPNEILNELSSGINKTLRKTIENSSIQDTMDIGLCSIDRETNMLEFAGAFNSLYLIRKNELIEIPADRFPIGVFLDGKLQEFTNHQMQLEKGDTIYLFSDGYPDQFGGPKGKKLKYKGFKEILLSIQQMSIEEQKNALNDTIEEWKWMSEEQTDDILIIGVRV